MSWNNPKAQDQQREGDLRQSSRPDTPSESPWPGDRRTAPPPDRSDPEQEEPRETAVWRAVGDARRAALTGDSIGTGVAFDLFFGDETIRIARIPGEVAIAVDTISAVGLYRSRETERFGVTAVAEAARPTIAILVENLIGGTATVVVEPIAVLGGDGTDARRSVVTVTAASAPAIAIDVNQIGSAVTVGIDLARTVTRRTGVDARVGIVAIPVAEVASVTVVVPPVIP
jgi:hypothetical protein